MTSTKYDPAQYRSDELLNELESIIRNAGSHFDGYIMFPIYHEQEHLDAVWTLLQRNPGRIFLTAGTDSAILIYPGQGMSVEFITSKVLGRIIHNHERCDECGSDVVQHQCIGCGRTIGHDCCLKCIIGASCPMVVSDGLCFRRNGCIDGIPTKETWRDVIVEATHKQIDYTPFFILAVDRGGWDSKELADATGVPQAGMVKRTSVVDNHGIAYELMVDALKLIDDRIEEHNCMDDKRIHSARGLIYEAIRTMEDIKGGGR